MKTKYVTLQQMTETGESKKLFYARVLKLLDILSLAHDITSFVFDTSTNTVKIQYVAKKV